MGIFLHLHCIIVSLFSFPFVLKCAANIFKMGSSIKNLYQKISSNRDFALARQIIKNLDVTEIVDLGHTLRNDT